MGSSCQSYCSLDVLVRFHTKTKLDLCVAICNLLSCLRAIFGIVSIRGDSIDDISAHVFGTGVIILVKAVVSASTAHNMERWSTHCSEVPVVILMLDKRKHFSSEDRSEHGQDVLIQDCDPDIGLLCRAQVSGWIGR